MPSFFEGLKRVIQGKPVFDPNDNQPTDSRDQYDPLADPAAPAQDAAQVQPPASSDNSEIQKNNPSTFPVVVIERTHTSRTSQGIEVYCTIKNSWHDELMLENLRLLGTVHRLGVLLHGGGSHEVQVYHGQAFLQPPPSQALLDYKTTSGDYFEAAFDVQASFTADKTYEVTELRLRPPVRDIYG